MYIVRSTPCEVRVFVETEVVKIELTLLASLLGKMSFALRCRTRCRAVPQRNTSGVKEP